MTWFIFLLLVLPIVYAQTSPCDAIEDAFSRIIDTKDSPACRCFVDSSTSSDDMWIGCNGHSMPAVFDSLRSLNETDLSKLHIWDSLTNILPSDMLAKVRPRSLIIEKSGLGLVREKVFAGIGTRLKHLTLRNNILKKVDPVVLQDLTKLQSLDISKNKISRITIEDMAPLSQLTELNLADNEIEYIEDSAFAKMTNLKTLSLQGNKLKSINNGTLKGLRSLEQLDLSRNYLDSIDWSTINEMKQLRVLNLGTNSLSSIQLRGFPHLHKILLNNNSFYSLRKLSLRDLPALQRITLDRNSISLIGENDLNGLVASTSLISFSIAANNISHINARALSPLSNVAVLSMQNNELKSLSSEKQPWLGPLRKLHTLLLSGNSISLIREGELPASLKIIALDHNNIQEIDGTAFLGLRPTHLYINNNHLNHLTRGIFDTFSNESLQAIDLSGNDWLCLCGEEWLGEWLANRSEMDMAEPRTNGCLSTKACSIHNPRQDESNSSWVTGLAALLAAISLVILVAIAWLFLDDTPRSIPPHKEYKARGVNVDRLRLINDRERSQSISTPLPSSARRVRFDGD